MGEPVRIVDLAERMIQLSGYEAGSLEEGVHRDIEIEFIGLRPGEKLHEELLLGNNVEGTEHPMIMRAEEECLSFDEIAGLLSELQRFCDAMDCDGISAILSSAVSGFGDHQVQHDHLWRKQNKRAAADNSNVQELFPDKP